MEEISIVSIKVVIIGDSNVGKTSVACRFVSNTFSIREPTTIMGAYYEAQRTYGNLNVKFVIWDTAGQERFQSITPLYYRGAQAAIIIYDITSMSSLTNVRKWFYQLHRNAGSIKAVVLCGNKCDQEDNREVSVDVGSVMASELGMSFHECSALNGKHVEDVFQEIVTSLYEGGLIRNPIVSPKNESVVELRPEIEKRKKKGKSKALKVKGCI